MALAVVANRINVVARGMCIRASSSLRDGGDSAGVAQSVARKTPSVYLFFLFIVGQGGGGGPCLLS